ncbi:MAG TPA: hypothetical protein VN445_01700 [Rectinemataceae bacterium]|nr:hypothetical protein [Rectinemataceae bacterium]
MMGRRRFFAVGLIFLLALAGGGRCDAQESEGSSASTSVPAGNAAQPSIPSTMPIPKTYSAANTGKAIVEVPAKLRRIAIISVGSFPIALFYTNFVFDIARFAGNGFDVQYAPWPFKNQYSAEVSSGETFLRLGVSLGVSTVIGVLDALIRRK